MIRFASGLPLDAGKTPIYEGDSDLPDIEKMDQIEREAYYRELKEQREQVETRVRNARIKAEEMKMETIVEERVAKRQAELEEKLLERYRQSQQPNPKTNL
jgi:predicted aspartyl protease